MKINKIEQSQFDNDGFLIQQQKEKIRRHNEILTDLYVLHETLNGNKERMKSNFIHFAYTEFRIFKGNEHEKLDKMLLNMKKYYSTDLEYMLSPYSTTILRCDYINTMYGRKLVPTTKFDELHDYPDLYNVNRLYMIESLSDECIEIMKIVYQYQPTSSIYISGYGFTTIQYCNNKYNYNYKTYDSLEDIRKHIWGDV